MERKSVSTVIEFIEAIRELTSSESKIAYDQIRNSVCYPNLNVKICATHSGITVGEDGATHQMLKILDL